MAEGSQRLVPFKLATLHLANSLQNPHGTPYTTPDFHQFMIDNPNSFKNLSIISKYTSVLPEPVTPSNNTGLFDLFNECVIFLNEFACSSLKFTKEGLVLLKLSNFSLSNSTISLLIRNNFKTAPSGAKV